MKTVKFNFNSDTKNMLSTVNIQYVLNCIFYIFLNKLIDAKKMELTFTDQAQHQNVFY